MLNPYLTGLLEYLSGQEVEIYLGNNKTTTLWGDHEIQLKNVIRGILVEAKGDCLVVLCELGGLKSNVYLNATWIQTIIATAEPLFIKDIFIDEHLLAEKRKQTKGF